MNRFLRYRLENQYHQIALMVEQFDEEFLYKRHIPGKWSIQEHLAHLGCYQDHFFERLTKIVLRHDTVFKRYVADEDPKFEDWLKKGNRQIIEDTKVWRGQVLIMLKNQSEMNKLHLTGKHPKFGKLTMSEWFDFFILHESHHQYAIFRMIKEFEK